MGKNVTASKKICPICGGPKDPGAKRCKNCYWKTRNYVETDETRKKRSEAKMGIKNPQWKGNDVSYMSLHGWVRSHYPKPEFCERCGERPAIDLANISGQYFRHLADYEYLCRKCHMHEDNRILNLKQYKK